MDNVEESASIKETKRDRRQQGTKHGPCLSVQPRMGRGDTPEPLLLKQGMCSAGRHSSVTKLKLSRFHLHIMFSRSQIQPWATADLHVPETVPKTSRPNIPAFFNSPLHDNSPFWCPSPNIQVTNVLLMCWVRTKHQEIILNQPYQH